MLNPTPCKHVAWLILLGVLSPLVAGEAVSGLNGKLGYNYGDYDSDSGQSLTGTVSAPLSAHFGVQGDAVYSHIAGNDFYGVGGHVFWRDWDKGLVGLAFGGVTSANVRTGEAGLETEYYTRYVTFGAYGGVSTIKYDNPVPFIKTDVTRPFGSVYLGFYPFPDLMIRPGYTRKLDNNQYHVEAEYELPRQNISITANAMVADHGFHQYQLGIRYYFGSRNKSLKFRHRQDDPVDIVSGSMTSIGTYGAEYIEKANAYIEELKAKTIASGGFLVFSGSSQTISISNISSVSLGGSGSFAKTSTGTVHFSGVNTYNGGTTISNGSLTLSGNFTLPSLDSVPVIDGGILTFAPLQTITVP